NWEVELLPYFEQDNVYKRWDYNDNRNNVIGGTTAIQAQDIEILLCPSDALPEHVVHLTAAAPPAWSRGLYAMSSYGGNAGKRSILTGDAPTFPLISRDGIFFLDSCVRLADITDGSSNTFLIGERYHRDPEHALRQAVDMPWVDSLAQLGK